MRSILAVLALAALPFTAPAQSPERLLGNWEGVLNTGVARLRLNILVERDSAAGFRCTMTSVDQGGAKIPGMAAIRGDSLLLTFPAANAKYDGMLSGDSIKGNFTQGVAFPLVFRKASGLGSAARPQDPKPPFPYQTRDVSFESVPGVKIAGTLVTPEGKGPFPAVVLVTGSGAQDRNEELMGHRPFLVIADYLARRGIASLRTDDRGVGQSTGLFGRATTADFANDAEAAVRFLRTDKSINPRRIGMIGHSEGGAIAPMVAARSKDVGFIVLLAGPGVPGDSILILQSRALMAAAGAAPDDIARVTRFNRAIYDILKSSPDSATAAERLKAKVGELVKELPEGARTDATEANIVRQTLPLLSPWYRFFVAYDPRPNLAKVKVPVLALNGTLDLQVPYRANLDAIRTAVLSGGNRNVQIVEFPGLNHLFQTAKTGQVTEYATIDETISPAVLERIATWILQQK